MSVELLLVELVVQFPLWCCFFFTFALSLTFLALFGFEIFFQEKFSTEKIGCEASSNFCVIFQAI